MATEKAAPVKRTKRGTFAAGVSGNPAGNPHFKHVAALRRVVNNAIGAEELQCILHKLFELGIENDDVSAMKILLDRVIGVARPAESLLNLKLPDISNVQGCTQATSKILQSVQTGELNVADANALGSLIFAQVRTLELVDVVKRLERLEARDKEPE